MLLDKKYLPIFIIQITEVLGFSLVLPFLPFYAQDLGASPLVVGLIFSSFSLFQFISAPILGRLSDIYGRKPLLIASQISTCIGFIILGLANSLWMIFLARIVDGLLGSNMTIAQAYLSDISSKKDRSKAFGLSGVAFGIGFLIGPGLGGLLAGINYSIPSFLAAGVSFLTILITALWLKETVPLRQSTVKQKIKIIDLQSITSYFGQPQIRVKLWQFFSFILTHTLWVTTFALYAERKLGIGAQQIGFALTYIGLISITIRGVFLSKLIDTFGEDFLRKTGFLFIVIAMVLATIINQWWMFFVLVTFFATGSGLIRPLVMGSISRQVSSHTQGELLGVTNSLQSIAQIVCPLVGGWIIAQLPPAFLGVAAGLLAVWGFIMARRDKPIIRGLS